MQGIYDTFALLWNNSAMKIAFAAMLVVSISSGASGQTAPAARGRKGPSLATATPAKVAEAYAQFLLAHRLEQADDVNAAIAAYKRAMELDPLAADTSAELSGLYLRQNRVPEAIATAEASLKVAPANREANRVLGVIYAAMVEAEKDPDNPAARAAGDNLVKAIRHLEVVLDGPVGETDPNVRATLARLYLRASAFDKAIALLADLVNHEPSWQDGPLLLIQAYAGAGRPKDAIAWLERQAPEDPRLLPVLADFYERERRWKDAAGAYASATAQAPRDLDLKIRYASALLNVGGHDNLIKARDLLSTVAAVRTTDARVLYLLSQAERRTGNFSAADATARRMIAAQGGASPWGYYALAEALEEHRDYKGVVAALTPAIAAIRARSGDNRADLSMLLPHLGFAHQELGEHAQAITILDEAHRLAPGDPALASYLIEANIAAKHYSAAVELAKEGLVASPGDLRLARLQARALSQDGKTEQGIAVLENFVKQQADVPAAYVALAQVYVDAARGTQAVKLLQDAEAKFPTDTSILFELGAVFDKQKQFVEAETTFRQVLAREPDNAQVLNYLGYMLAERGERLDESVTLVKKALEKEPYNGSYLDSLGWAYFKADKFELAEDNLRRAADQLKVNSVVQDHYGDVLFRLARYDEAIAAWTKALEGDGDTIERPAIDRKIRAAKQKLGKK